MAKANWRIEIEPIFPPYPVSLINLFSRHPDGETVFNLVYSPPNTVIRNEDEPIFPDLCGGIFKYSLQVLFLIQGVFKSFDYSVLGIKREMGY